MERKKIDRIFNNGTFFVSLADYALMMYLLDALPVLHRPTRQGEE